MKFVIREIKENGREIFNSMAEHPVQSWEWGEFRKKTGNKVVRLGLFKGKQFIEGYQLTVHLIPHTNFKLGVFLKGPKPTAQMLSTLKEFAKNEGLIFIRMEPNVVKRLSAQAGKTENTKHIEDLLKGSGAKPGRTFFTPGTFLIDLTKPEDGLLAAMHPKTRYNIRVAQKHGVEIIEDNSKKSFEAYLDLMHETTKRQGFYAHTEKYHRLMWETLKIPNSPPAPRLRQAGKFQIPNSQKLTTRLLLAKYKKEIIAAWILFVWKDTLYYPYGASTDKYKNVMANYAMMWEAIKFGKKLGLKKFDLWGREEGKGFTRFKEGFSPQVVEFLGTWDLVINPVLYTLYRIAEEIRWKILKLPLPFPKPKFR